MSYYVAYVAGPMTGYPNYNFDMFDEVETHLNVHGLPGDLDRLRVINPACNFNRDQSLPRRVYLAKAMQQVTAADAIVLLPKWHQSEGAQLEVSLGLDLGKDFYVAVKPYGVEWDIRPTNAGLIRTVLEELADKKPADPEPLADWERELLEGKIGVLGTGEHLPELGCCGGWDEYAADNNAAVSQDYPEEIEQEAGRLVRRGARQQTYGHPRGDFDRVALMWQGIAGIPFTAEQVAVMMIAFKLARLSQTPQHRDSKVDVIGYTICLDRLDEPVAA